MKEDKYTKILAKNLIFVLRQGTARNVEIAKSPKIGNVNVVNPHKSCFRAKAHLVFH